jgi:pyridoxal phosphate enzyme (YggS family)
MITAEGVGERLAAVRARIRAAGGDPEAVTVVAVTKTFGPEAVIAAIAAGVRDVGENYAQELLEKAAGVAESTGHAAGSPYPDQGPRWHFIGQLQRNKVRALAGTVALWQSVDRAELASEIARRAPGASVLVQLNLSGEAQKGGCAASDAPPLVDEARRLGLDVRGLMGVGPAGSREAARPGFDQLVALADRLELPVRCIGMSGDLDEAVAAGATMVRIGTALFGARPPRG